MQTNVRHLRKQNPKVTRNVQAMQYLMWLSLIDDAVTRYLAGTNTPLHITFMRTSYIHVIRYISSYRPLQSLLEKILCCFPLLCHFSSHSTIPPQLNLPFFPHPITNSPPALLSLPLQTPNHSLILYSRSSLLSISPSYSLSALAVHFNLPLHLQ